MSQDELLKETQKSLSKLYEAALETIITIHGSESHFARQLKEQAKEDLGTHAPKY